MMGLASIYRKYSLQGEGGREASKQISWIKDKLLHIYYQNSIDDRFVCMFFCWLQFKMYSFSTWEFNFLTFCVIAEEKAGSGAFQSLNLL